MQNPVAPVCDGEVGSVLKTVGDGVSFGTRSLGLLPGEHHAFGGSVAVKSGGNGITREQQAQTAGRCCVVVGIFVAVEHYTCCHLDAVAFECGRCCNGDDEVRLASGGKVSSGCGGADDHAGSRELYEAVASSGSLHTVVPNADGGTAGLVGTEVDGKFQHLDGKVALHLVKDADVVDVDEA